MQKLWYGKLLHTAASPQGSDYTEKIFTHNETFTMRRFYTRLWIFYTEKPLRSSFYRGFYTAKFLHTEALHFARKDCNWYFHVPLTLQTCVPEFHPHLVWKGCVWHFKTAVHKMLPFDPHSIQKGGVEDHTSRMSPHVWTSDTHDFWRGLLGPNTFSSDFHHMIGRPARTVSAQRVTFCWTWLGCPCCHKRYGSLRCTSLSGVTTPV